MTKKLYSADDLKYFVTHLRFEALALAILMVVLTYKSSAPVWILFVTFLLFDICMIGYAINPKVGSIMYNLIHNATIPTLFVATGVLFDLEVVAIIGFCWTFHTAIDRVLGYGLKHESSFNHTHLGKIRKN